jgi:hypothetical protein
MNKSFQADVEAQVTRLRESKYRCIESEVVEKRKLWVREHGAAGARAVSPREAYELFLLEYLGLSEKQVPVVLENEREIVWHSYNACPTLEACARLGLDTRTVCRRIYEKPSQAFLSHLDPHLRFWRSYEEIRPYYPYCKEGIARLDSRKYG